MHHTRIPPGAQKRVPKRVQHKRTHWLLISLVRFLGNRLEGLGVLFPKAGGLYVTAARSRKPYPAFFGLVRLIPS
jgi:hypothetical protein